MCGILVNSSKENEINWQIFKNISSPKLMKKILCWITKWKLVSNVQNSEFQAYTQQAYAKGNK